jgi:hypothetical protein
MSYPLVKRVSHRMLGEMLRMMLNELVYFDLTLEEGRTHCRALSPLWPMTGGVPISFI